MEEQGEGFREKASHSFLTVFLFLFPPSVFFFFFCTYSSHSLPARPPFFFFVLKYQKGV